MKYTLYLLCEPGMDRPCVSHVPPSDAQRARLAGTGGRWYSMDVDIPDYDMPDGKLHPVLSGL